jgi:thiol-disulfide isomerase/thioredoxin
MSRLLAHVLLIFFTIHFLPEGQAQLSFQHWTLEHTRQVASAEDRLFFLYFTAEWCAPCRWMEEHTLRDAELTEYVETNFLAIEIDVDQGPAALLRKQFAVEDIPSILVFSAAGQLIDRHRGTLSAADLQQWLKALDQPIHHLQAVQTPAAATTLASPQAQLEFSRPALGHSESLTPSLAQGASTKLILPGEPTMASAQPEALAPRTAGSYAVVLTDRSYTYEEALLEVSRLERKYQQRTELHPQGNGTHRIILGDFSRRQAAQAFLVYLRRNNRQGEILTLGR